METQNKIVILRHSAGLTQQQLADASGISARHIQYLESASRELGKMSLATAVALAKALNVSPEEFLK